eukprot:jgi/Ulvmu1/12102/UM084_0027.1
MHLQSSSCMCCLSYLALSLDAFVFQDVLLTLVALDWPVQTALMPCGHVIRQGCAVYTAHGLDQTAGGYSLDTRPACLCHLQGSGRMQLPLPIILSQERSNTSPRQ